MMFAVFMFACESANFKFEDHGKIGVQVEFDSGTAFCAYDQDLRIKETKIDAELTCSFTAKKDDVVYSCEKIKLSKIDKTFKLEKECLVILDLRKDVDKKNE